MGVSGKQLSLVTHLFLHEIYKEISIFFFIDTVRKIAFLFVAND